MLATAEEGRSSAQWQDGGEGGSRGRPGRQGGLERGMRRPPRLAPDRHRHLSLHRHRGVHPAARCPRRRLRPASRRPRAHLARRHRRRRRDRGRHRGGLFLRRLPHRPRRGAGSGYGAAGSGAQRVATRRIGQGEDGAAHRDRNPGARRLYRDGCPPGCPYRRRRARRTGPALGSHGRVGAGRPPRWCDPYLSGDPCPARRPPAGAALPTVDRRPRDRVPRHQSRRRRHRQPPRSPHHLRRPRGGVGCAHRPGGQAVHWSRWWGPEAPGSRGSPSRWGGPWTPSSATGSGSSRWPT